MEPIIEIAKFTPKEINEAIEGMDGLQNIIAPILRKSNYEGKGEEDVQLFKRHIMLAKHALIAMGDLLESKMNPQSAIPVKKVVNLPCEIGDTLFIASEYQGIVESKVRSFWIGRVAFSTEIRELMIRTTHCDVPVENIGKTVFFTREEAEASKK